MNMAFSINRENSFAGFLLAREHADPIVALSMRYNDLISMIESADTDDDEADRYMSEAMDIEAIMQRIEPVSIAGYVATQEFTRHFR
jgi:hypothetical protein